MEIRRRKLAVGNIMDPTMTKEIQRQGREEQEVDPGYGLLDLLARIYTGTVTGRRDLVTC
jgi:hypothetical protein